MEPYGGGQLHAAYRTARLKVRTYHRIRLEDLKLWALNEARNGIHLRNRCQSFLHSKQIMITAISSRYQELKSWCSCKKGFYKQIQEGKTSSSKLLQDQIGRLETLGLIE